MNLRLGIFLQYNYPIDHHTSLGYTTAMSTLKTIENDASVKDFIQSVPDEQKQKDAFILVDLYTKLTGEEPKMWGPSIIGFGKYHYKSERSKQEGDWLMAGFSPRKQNLTLYLIHGTEKYTELLKDLGKHKISAGSCIYINRLSDVDMEVLEKIIKKSFTDMKEIYG